MLNTVRPSFIQMKLIRWIERMSSGIVAKMCFWVKKMRLSFWKLKKKFSKTFLDHVTRSGIEPSTFRLELYLTPCWAIRAHTTLIGRRSHNHAVLFTIRYFGKVYSEVYFPQFEAIRLNFFLGRRLSCKGGLENATDWVSDESKLPWASYGPREVIP